MKSACANCNRAGEPSTAFPDTPDLSQRIEPGGEVPGALCCSVPTNKRAQKQAPKKP